MVIVRRCSGAASCRRFDSSLKTFVRVALAAVIIVESPRKLGWRSASKLKSSSCGKPIVLSSCARLGGDRSLSSNRLINDATLLPGDDVASGFSGLRWSLNRPCTDGFVGVASVVSAS